MLQQNKDSGILRIATAAQIFILTQNWIKIRMECLAIILSQRSQKVFNSLIKTKETFITQKEN